MAEEHNSEPKNDFEKIVAKLAELRPLAEKFYNKKNKRAGVELRKGYLETIQLLKDARGNVQAIKQLDKQLDNLADSQNT